jgi:catechol 2,3-dioxygenase-like lactoylglutathione lyase family enzyme
VTPKLVPELVCSDLAASLDFYTRILGFQIAYRRPEDGFAYLEREGAELMLEQPRGRSLVAGPLEQPYGRGMNLQIDVSDVDTLYDAVRSAGALVFLPIEEKWYRREDRLLGNRQFVVQDPDGYLLRFFRDLGTRPAAQR